MATVNDLHNLTAHHLLSNISASINQPNNNSISHTQDEQLLHLDHQHYHQQQPQPQAALFTEPVSQTKLLASVVLFAITLLCGYLPVRCILNQNYIQYAMFAGGGVLMATAFCHLIPEAHDNYKIAKGLSSTVHSHGHHHHHHQDDHHDLLHLQQPINDTFASNLTTSNITTTTTTTTAAVQLMLGLPVNASDPEPSVGPMSELNVPYLEITLCCGFFFMYLVEQLMVRFINNHSHEHPCDTSMGQLVGTSEPHLQDNGTGSSRGASTTAINLTSSSNSTSGAHNGTEFYKFLRGLLIVSAFGAHSIFDGVAIGSQETIEKVWTIFLAISCHKLIIAAVVGLELYAATLESNLWTLVHLSIFSIMSPIGIILVVLAQNSLHLDSNHPAMILLQSFATGTLLYIVFVEILQPKESQTYEKNRIGKSFSLIAGFALMLIVLTVIGEG